MGTGTQKKQFGNKKKQTELDNKTFTNLLISGLMDLANKKDDFVEGNLLNTPGYYCKAYPKEMNALKKRLEEFTPIGKNEKSSWVAACECIAQSLKVF